MMKTIQLIIISMTMMLSILHAQNPEYEAILGRVDTYPELNLCLQKKSLENLVFQKLDFSDTEDKFLKIPFSKCLFLGCKISPRLKAHLSAENYIFPQPDVPYPVFPALLYNKETLYNGYDFNNPDSYTQTLDKTVYDRFKAIGAETSDVAEMLSRSLHDCSMRIALQEFLEKFDEKRIIAVMGGHNMSRQDTTYKQVAFLSKSLAEKGYLMISGGGPGAMEATHLGVWFAGKSNNDLLDAIQILSIAPRYNDALWLPTAFKVFEKYPKTNYVSLSIPTWFYGHEPPTPFSTHIAKLFENSLREEGLLAIAKGGIIYSPGSAGTIQEIFQDLTQNHYESYGYASPMIFMNKKYWTEDRPIYPLIRTMIDEDKLNKKIILEIFDDNEDIIYFLEKRE